MHSCCVISSEQQASSGWRNLRNHYSPFFDLRGFKAGCVTHPLPLEDKEGEMDIFYLLSPSIAHGTACNHHLWELHRQEAETAFDIFPPWMFVSKRSFCQSVVIRNHSCTIVLLKMKTRFSKKNSARHTGNGSHSSLVLLGSVRTWGFIPAVTDLSILLPFLLTADTKAACICLTMDAPITGLSLVPKVTQVTSQSETELIDNEITTDAVDVSCIWRSSALTMGSCSFPADNYKNIHEKSIQKMIWWC